MALADAMEMPGTSASGGAAPVFFAGERALLRTHRGAEDERERRADPRSTRSASAPDDCVTGAVGQRTTPYTVAAPNRARRAAPCVGIARDRGQPAA